MDSSNTLSGSPLTQTELDTRLLKAAQDGDTDTVSALISTGANINAVNQHGDTPLILAASKGHIDIVSVLIAARANVNTADQYGDTALMVAVYLGHIDIVSVLIAAGANVNAVNQDGYTALMAAASNGHTNIVSVLIAAEADVNATNQDGYTALMLAAIRGHITTVSALIAAGANVNAVNQGGFTALMLAVYRNHHQTAFRLLNAVPPQEISTLMNSLLRHQPAIAQVEAAYHQALAEFRQELTNMLSALNEGTGRHALGTTNALLHIIASYYAPDWCGRPSEEMCNILIAMNRPPFNSNESPSIPSVYVNQFRQYSGTCCIQSY